LNKHSRAAVKGWPSRTISF